jgi:hypothetical protein
MDGMDDMITQARGRYPTKFGQDESGSEKFKTKTIIVMIFCILLPG